jgi:hypothetical protein
MFVALSLGIGCGTASLTLTPTPAVDQTVPKRTDRQFTSVMVLPPSGTERGEDPEMATVERVLLSAGIKVISSAVTGRIVQDVSGNRVETGANLPYLERALVMARGSNADAVLQVIRVGWTDGQRWFVRSASGDQLQEIGPGVMLDASNSVRVREAFYQFQARVISVDKGEIVMSIEASQTTSRSPAQPITFSWQSSPGGLSGPREIDTNTPEHRREVVDEVMAVVLARLTGR